MRSVSRLRIRQDAHYQGNDWWRWSVYLDGADADLDRVSKVDYILHSSFPDPVRSITDRSTRFRLETGGWGVFRLYARVYLKDAPEVIRLHHDLQLHYPAGHDPTARTSSQTAPPAAAAAVSSPPDSAPAPLSFTAAPANFRIYLAHSESSRRDVQAFARELMVVSGHQINVATTADARQSSGGYSMDQIRSGLEQANLLLALYRGPSEENLRLGYEAGYFRAYHAGQGDPRRTIVIRTPGVTLPESLADAETWEGDRGTLASLLHDLFAVPLSDGAQPITSGEDVARVMQPLLAHAVSAVGVRPATSVWFDLTVQIRVSPEESGAVESGTIPPTAAITGNPNALEILGINVATSCGRVKSKSAGAKLTSGPFTWERTLEIMRNLGGGEDTGSMWLERLSALCADATQYKPLRSGLPLFWSKRKSRAYRPTLFRLDRGSDGGYVFHVSFADLPQELNAWPEGALGAFSHILTLARIFRWGVILPYRKKLGATDDAQLPQLVKQLQEATDNVIVDGRNRGINPDDVSAVLTHDQNAELNTTNEQWSEVYGRLRRLSFLESRTKQSIAAIIDEMDGINQRYLRLFAGLYVEHLDRALRPIELARPSTAMDARFGAPPAPALSESRERETTA